MAKGEIKTKLTLEGEAEYKRQMQEAANAVKVLDSEQKLAAAQFRNTGDAQQYAADQARILNEKMQAQQKAVDAARTALEQLKAKGVDPSDKAYQEWTKRLNNASTSLTNMKTDLDNVQTGMGNVTGAAGDLDNTMTVIDPETRFQNTLHAIEGMRDRLNSVISAAARAGKAIWDMETDAGKWADDLVTAATKAGMDVETYQSWQYASRFIDTSVDDIVASYKTLVSNMTSSNTDTAKLFNNLGVVTRSGAKDARDYQEAFFDVIDALGQMENKTAQAEYAQKLLGGSWRNLLPLIEAGSQAYKDTAETGKQVAVVDEDQVQKLASLNDAQEQMNASLDKAKYTLLSEIAPAFETVTDGITKASQAFTDFLSTEEGRQAMSELNEALKGVIESFLGEDNGAGTFKAIVEGAKGAVEGFTTAMSWISEHGEEVKAVIIGLGVAWAGLNVAPPVMEFMHLLHDTPFNKIKTMMGSDAAGSGAAAASAAMNGGTAAAENTLLGQTSLFNFATRMGLMAAATYGADKVYESLPGGRSAIKDIGYNLGLYNYTPFSKDGQEIFNSIKQAVTEGMDAAQFTKEKYGSEKLGEYYTQKTDTWARWDASGQRYNAKQNLENTYAQLEKMADEAAKQVAAKGQEAAENYAKAIQDKAPEAATAADTMAKGAVDAAEQEMSFMEAIGANAGQGLANGLISKEGEVTAAAQRLAGGVTAIVQSSLQIRSPSKVMERLGEYTTEGFVSGLTRRIDAVQRAVSAVADTTTRGLIPAAQPARAMPAAGGEPRRIVLMIDKRAVCEAMVDEMDAQMGTIIKSRR